ncbi:hypothetical protein HPB47_017129, partial [Ixodes persulcatus]
ADVTVSDGIYSAYFTQFNGEGRYSVVAEIVGDGSAITNVTIKIPEVVVSEAKIKNRTDFYSSARVLNKDGLDSGASNIALATFDHPSPRQQQKPSASKNWGLIIGVPPVRRRTAGNVTAGGSGGSGIECTSAAAWCPICCGAGLLPMSFLPLVSQVISAHRLAAIVLELQTAQLSGTFPAAFFVQLPGPATPELRTHSDVLRFNTLAREWSGLRISAPWPARPFQDLATVTF